jgi:hypothetical protein
VEAGVRVLGRQKGIGGDANRWSGEPVGRWAGPRIKANSLPALGGRGPATASVSLKILKKHQSNVGEYVIFATNSNDSHDTM